MQFPILDIKNLVSQCNRGCQKALAKFQTLSDESITALQQANAYYEKIPHHLMGVKSTHQHRKTLVKNIDQQNAHQFHLDKYNYEQDRAKKRLHNWQIKQHQILKDAKIWKRFEQQCQSKTQLNKILTLKNVWLSQERFSYCTSDGLIEMAKQVLPLFENYADLLTVEYTTYRHTLPSDTKSALKRYLLTLQNTIAQEKQALAEAMLSRLSVASYHRDVHFDDVTQHVASELNEMQLIHIRLPRECHTTSSSENVGYFVQFIMQQGNPQQKKALIQLNLFKASSNYLIISDARQLLIVPARLSARIQHPSYLHRLLGIHKTNKHFLHTHLGLIAELRFPSNPLNDYIALKSFYRNESWRHLCQLGQTINEHDQIASQSKQGGWFTRFLQKENKSFNDAWRDYLREAQFTIATRMLNFAHRITEELKTRIELGLDIDLLCSPPFQRDINQFRTDITQFIDQLGHPSDRFPHYASFLAVCDKVKNLPHEREKAYQDKIIAERNKIESIDEFIEWSHQTDTHKTNKENKGPLDLSEFNLSEDEFNPFLPLSEQDSADEMLSCLTALCNKDMATELATNPFEELMKRILSMIETLGGNAVHLLQNEAIYETVTTLFKSYLTTWIGVSNESDEEKTTLKDSLRGIESLIHTLATPSMQQSLDELIAIRDHQDGFLFQVKCHALLSSLEETESNIEHDGLSHLAPLENQLTARKAKTIKSMTFKHVDTHKNGPLTHFFRSQHLVENERKTQIAKQATFTY